LLSQGWQRRILHRRILVYEFRCWYVLGVKLKVMKGRWLVLRIDNQFFLISPPLPFWCTPRNNTCICAYYKWRSTFVELKDYQTLFFVFKKNARWCGNFRKILLKFKPQPGAESGLQSRRRLVLGGEDRMCAVLLLN